MTFESADVVTAVHPGGEPVGCDLGVEALLTLSNGAEGLFAVAGRGCGRGAVLSLRGVAADPAAMRIGIRTTIAPLEGGWARIEALSACGYGQTLGW